MIDGLGEHMLRRKKEQSFLETSKKDDHMLWQSRRLEASRRTLHLCVSREGF